MDNSGTQGFAGESGISYADVLSGRMGTTIVVRVSRGSDARIHCLLTLFTTGIVAILFEDHLTIM